MLLKKITRIDDESSRSNIQKIQTFLLTPFFLFFPWKRIYRDDANWINAINKKKISKLGQRLIVKTLLQGDRFFWIKKKKILGNMNDDKMIIWPSFFSSRHPSWVTVNWKKKRKKYWAWHTNFSGPTRIKLKFYYLDVYYYRECLDKLKCG